MSTMQRSYVFISYAHANASLVQRLSADMKMRGINAWIDKSGLKAGEPDWENALRVAISGASAVILIASPDARASRYVRDELRIADMYHRRIYPVWVAGEQWMDSVPMGLGGIQYIDAREQRYWIAMDELATALSGAPPLTAQVPVPSSLPTHRPATGNTSHQMVNSPPLTKRASNNKSTWTCLISALVALALIIVLATLVISPLINFISGILRNGGISPDSGQLHVTPTSINLTHTQGGTQGSGCFYTPSNGWDCPVTLQNTSTTGQFKWSTHVSPDTITLSPSAAIVPLSAGSSTEVTIHIPESSCGHTVVTFKGPENSVNVTIDCS